MNTQAKEKWYYIIVQNPGISDEEIVGYNDEENGTIFIPAFESKEIAQQCFMIMPKDVMRKKYEAQAIIEEDLLSHAAKENFKVYLLDDKGTKLKIVE